MTQARSYWVVREREGGDMFCETQQEAVELIRWYSTRYPESGPYRMILVTERDVDWQEIGTDGYAYEVEIIGPLTVKQWLDHLQQEAR